jgi:hypothetical protein
MGRALVVGLMLSATGSLAGEAAPKLNCPANTRQFGNPQEGLICRKPNPAGDLGVAHGPYASFHANGQKDAEGQYVDGFRSGTWSFYSENGQLRSRIEFQTGNYHGKREEFFPNGKLRIIESYVAGKLNGLVKEFSEDGQLVRQAEYRDNQEVASK